jgi:organic hydroperoxide reductase OsmC/OhrA
MGRTHSYAVSVRWTGNTGAGTSGYKAYERAHEVTTEGKPAIEGSADPAFYGAKDRWNPEELLVAALSQCHMLSYLALAARDGVVVTSYHDAAVGQMAETAGWSGQFTEVVLSPVVTVADPSMVRKAQDLHQAAHETCFIANSVNFPVRHDPHVSA